MFPLDTPGVETKQFFFSDASWTLGESDKFASISEFACISSISDFLFPNKSTTGRH